MATLTELALYAGLIGAGIVGVWMLIGAFSVRGIETPKYITLERRKGGYEIREYEPYVVAETTVSGSYSEAVNRGFRIIADYIFGNNVRVGSSQLQGVVSSIGNLETIEAGGEGASEKIAMTAPVLSEKRDANDGEKDRYNISFVMPSKYSFEAMPVPRDERVRLREVKKRISAAVRFSGYATEDQVQTKYRQLRQMLAEDEVSVHPGYQVAQYNPPWTPPFMRRNEVLIDVAS